MGSEDEKAFKLLEYRLTTILPEMYHDCYEDVQPLSMGSAGLKYGADGKVAWNEIWATFCDLAMAGGPPHKGTLLEPGSPAQIRAQPNRYQEVAEEICRGVNMVTDLPAKTSPIPGWVCVECDIEVTAAWLMRAITMENVSARFTGTALYLPAGPAYRMEKEIKNVIAAIAKTCHYWFGHIGLGQQRAIADLFEEMERESPLVHPAMPASEPQRMDEEEALRIKLAESIYHATGLRASNHLYPGWLGLNCPDDRAAIWFMRGMVVSNALSRREGTAVFVPINPLADPNGETVTRLLTGIRRFASARAIF